MGKSKKIKIPNGNGEEIVGSYYKAKDDNILVIYCHGTLSTSEFPKERDMVGNFYQNRNVSIFMFDYPGESLRLDQKRRYRNVLHKRRIYNLEYILRYFRPKHKKIVLAGHSLGTIDVVLASKFYKDLYDKQYLVNGIYSLKYMPIKKIVYLYYLLTTNYALRKDYLFVLLNLKPKKITTPTLILVGEKDEIVNLKNSYWLFEVLKCQKKLITVPDGDHVLLDPKYTKEYADELIKWVLD